MVPTVRVLGGGESVNIVGAGVRRVPTPTRLITAPVKYIYTSLNS